jgi:hypothetical protein
MIVFGGTGRTRSSLNRGCVIASEHSSRDMGSGTRVDQPGMKCCRVQSSTSLLEGIALQWIMRSGTLLLGIIAFSVGSASPAMAQRFPFEQSFDVTGPSVLDVSMIRGKIEVTAGEPARIVVEGTATVRVDWNAPANATELARHVAENPPIRRDGQTVKLRLPSDPTEQRAVTVS